MILTDHTILAMAAKQCYLCSCMVNLNIFYIMLCEHLLCLLNNNETLIYDCFIDYVVIGFNKSLYNY